MLGKLLGTSWLLHFPLLQLPVDTIQFDGEIQQYVVELAWRLGLFFLGAILSPLVGRSLVQLLWFAFYLANCWVGEDTIDPYSNLVRPFRGSLTTTGTLLFIAFCLNLLVKYDDLYTFLGFFIYLALSVSVAWLASKVTQRAIRRSIITVLRRRGTEVNEVILMFETLTNILIVLLAVAIFAQGLRLNLVALSASLGIGGVAVAFASRQALERLIGTIELYLDRPYMPGEYIRVTFNPFKEDAYGRVESIGLRSTKIRTVAKNTLIVVPNSMMAGMNIENITRGKKIMAMLCLDFSRPLKEPEKALVQRTIEQVSQSFWGLDKANTRVQFSLLETRPGTRARVNFFITGSGVDSLELRKRLLELANDEMTRALLTYDLVFTVPEPMVYVDSPMSL